MWVMISPQGEDFTYHAAFYALTIWQNQPHVFSGTRKIPARQLAKYFQQGGKPFSLSSEERAGVRTDVKTNFSRW